MELPLHNKRKQISSHSLYLHHRQGRSDVVSTFLSFCFIIKSLEEVTWEVLLKKRLDMETIVGENVQWTNIVNYNNLLAIIS